VTKPSSPLAQVVERRFVVFRFPSSLAAQWLLLLLIWMAPTWVFAADELPIDKLIVQAKIPREGDFMGFGC